MVLTPSTMLPLGTKAPGFRLPDTEGKTVSLDDFRDAPALVVLFICNHCPYVKHIRRALAAVGADMQKKGVAVVAVNSNDAETYPDDSPEKMAREKQETGYPFPYLFDETQEVAKAYHAACTPDIYVFDGARRLAYRGQFDASRPGNDKPSDGRDLREAVARVVAGASLDPAAQIPSIGCNIKWKPGNAPEYFGA